MTIYIFLISYMASVDLAVNLLLWLQVAYIPRFLLNESLSSYIITGLPYTSQNYERN